MTVDMTNNRVPYGLLTAEIGELQEVFDFQWRANMRAVEMWRAANPGNDLVLPDSAKLTVWLLERTEALTAERDEWKARSREVLTAGLEIKAKLEKAVEALRGFMSKVDTACLVERDHPQAEFADAWRDAYAVIAEIELVSKEGEKE